MTQLVAQIDSEYEMPEMSPEDEELLNLLFFCKATTQERFDQDVQQILFELTKCDKLSLSKVD